MNYIQKKDYAARFTSDELGFNEEKNISGKKKKSKG